MDGPYLLALGFAAGLSGAMMPGPLLAYTVARSMEKGWKTGFYVIAGHVLVEVALLAAILAGVSSLMSSVTFVKAVGLAGGAFMAYTGLALAGSGLRLGDGMGSTHGTLVSGALFTALNPGFPLWWATVGAMLLADGFGSAGMPGAALVVGGHWLADLGWYVLVSSLVSWGRERLLREYSAAARKGLAALMLLMGGYFLRASL